jgi:hypothetical protein
MVVYHKSIGFPAFVRLPEEVYLRLTYSRHAKHKRKALNLTLPHNEIVMFPFDSIIEMYITKKRRIKKILVRRPYDSKKDIIFVLELKHFDAKVVTFWFNNKRDNHSTLDKTKYAKP